MSRLSGYQRGVTPVFYPGRPHWTVHVAYRLEAAAMWLRVRQQRKHPIGGTQPLR